MFDPLVDLTPIHCSMAVDVIRVTANIAQLLKNDLSDSEEAPIEDNNIPKDLGKHCGETSQTRLARGKG